MKTVLIVLSVLLIMAGCNNNASGDATADTTTTPAETVVPKADSVLVTTEAYSGILPCADCEGIETSIGLNSDGTFSKHLLYMGRKSTGAGSNEFSSTGQWMLHGMDTVHLTGLKDEPSMYIRTDSSLVQLDMSGKRITGKLAGKYELKKNMIK